MGYNSVNSILPKYYNNIAFLGNNSIVNTQGVSTVDYAQRQNELINSKGNQAFISMGQAQISKSNLPDCDTTPQQYISNLIKQGQIPNKNFTINESTRSDNRYAYVGITEVDSKGKIIKETVFITDTPDNPKYSLGFVKLYNTETGLPYKKIAYLDKKDGTYLVENYNSQAEEKVSSILYAKDGSVIETDNKLKN